ncbi:MAG: hypothetical protein RBT34_03380, partial [Anaerolineaceae bacterium]|nr:hypothetical protein [Anaerolineaceae bacterium]
MKFHEHAYSRRHGFTIDYGREIEEEIVLIEQAVDQHEQISQKFPSRWLAIKLLEKDADIETKLETLP